MGVPATQSIPIIIGGSVLIGAVLGLILLGEKLMLHGWSGILMLVIGIGLVATDPGDKVEEGGGASDNATAPPLFVWIVPALICATAYAVYNIMIKKYVPDKLHNSFVAQLSIISYHTFIYSFPAGALHPSILFWEEWSYSLLLRFLVLFSLVPFRFMKEARAFLITIAWESFGRVVPEWQLGRQSK